MQKPQSTQTANLIEDPSETFKNSENEHRLFCKCELPYDSERCAIYHYAYT